MLKVDAENVLSILLIALPVSSILTLNNFPVVFINVWLILIADLDHYINIRSESGDDNEMRYVNKMKKIFFK